MPSKAELKQEIDNLRASLKTATERLTTLEHNPREVRMITVECPICKKIVEIPEYDRITRSDALKIHIEKEHSHHSGNPVCFSAIEKLESDIAKGKSHWDIVNEQYYRGTEGKDGCLPCERDYVEVKDALASVGSRYTGLVHSDDINVEEIAASVREHTAREIERAESRAKSVALSCGIKLTRVRSRLLKMKPLAHVGRWAEFMSSQRQLLPDFEFDIREAIPDIEVRIPIFRVAEPEVEPEYKRIKASLSEEDRKKLEEKEEAERIAKRGIVPREWAPYKCPQCSRRFSTLEAMHEHIRQAHEEYKCPYCEERFKITGELFKHVKEIHLKELQKTTGRT